MSKFSGSMYDPQALEARANYSNTWHSELLATPVSDCPFCCFATCCPYCASFHLRARVLNNDLSRYQCCGGYMPCSGSCGESRCPAFCLCQEVFWCFPSSVASTRFMLQDQLTIQNTQCDNCIISFMFILNQLACIFSCIACLIGDQDLADFANALNCLADLAYCSVCSCMQTQHKLELDRRDGKLGPVIMSVPMAPPPPQQMQ